MAEPPVDVSVIVAVKNGAPTLGQCLDSILTQTGCTVEVVVIDALSDDGTSEIIASYGDRIAHSVREPDEGIYDAWNKALTVARGEWCAFLGADDWFLGPQSLAALLRTAREPGQVPVFVHGGVIRTGGAEEFVAHPEPVDVFKYLRSGKMLPHQGILHNVGALRAIRGFDDSFFIMGDYAAVTKLVLDGPVRRCPEVTTAMAIGGVSSNWLTSGLAARERFYILWRVRSFGFALWIFSTTRPIAVAAKAFEAAVLTLCGQERGTAVILQLRRLIGRPPKLI